MVRELALDWYASRPASGQSHTFRAVVWNSFSEAVIWQSGYESTAFIHLKWAATPYGSMQKNGEGGIDRR